MKNTFLAKTYTLTLTVPKAILLGLVSLILISWFFFLGLVVGRGYEPENVIPQVAQMMPQAEQISSPASTSAEALSQAQQQIANVDNNGRSIIAEADRAYRASRRQEGTQAPTSGTTPGTTSGTTSSVRPPSLTPPPATGQGTASQGQPAAGGNAATFKFVYQLASFKEEKAAQELKTKLTSAGYNARVTTSQGAKSTWYRLIIDFTGSEAQAETTRASIKKNFKLGEPLKLSQKKSGA